MISLLCVAFGQPVWSWPLSALSACIGYALFWRVLLAHETWRFRFLLGMGWFGAVQLIQLYWFIAHPYWYIFLVYFFLVVMMGLQFGFLCILLRFRMGSKIFHSLLIAAVWTIFEWSRLYFLSGFSFNPVGLSLTANVYSLQAANIAGILGLSFWVIFTNAIVLFTWVTPVTFKKWMFLTCVVFAPYLYGLVVIGYHHRQMQEHPPEYFKALLVQTAFEVEESPHSSAQKDLLLYVQNEWKQILNIIKKHVGQPIDLIVLPEFVVPFGTYTFVYPIGDVIHTFKEVFGKEAVQYLPRLEWPLAMTRQQGKRLEVKVNNAFWIQGIANYFHADVIAGLQDAEEIEEGNVEYYSAALLFHPEADKEGEFYTERYEKQVLVPMGEYIPFAFLKEFAAKYGVTSSFTHGKEAKVFTSAGIAISPSICYEETFAHVICEGKQKGADLFVNLTSDVWYPNSCLPRQHLDHARPRTVENGIPLIRACNTGITAAIDSLGRDIAVLGGSHPEDVEWVADSLLVSVPLYRYTTLYSQWGDRPLILLCLFLCLCGIYRNTFRSYRAPLQGA